MSSDGIGGREDQRSSGPEGHSPEIIAFECWKHFTYSDILISIRNRPLPPQIDPLEVLNDCYIKTLEKHPGSIPIAFDIESTRTVAGAEARNEIRNINRYILDLARRGRRIKLKDGDSSAGGDTGQQGRPARTTVPRDKHLGDAAVDLPARENSLMNVDLAIDLAAALREVHPDAAQMLWDNSQGISVRAIAEKFGITPGMARGIIDRAKARLASLLKAYNPDDIPES